MISTSFSIPLTLIIVVISLSVLGLMGWIWINRRKKQTFEKTDHNIPLSLDLTRHTEAYLLIQRGGIVRHISNTAREMFHVGTGAVHLERLARRVRPSESFLSLCAGEGRGRFTLDGRLIEGISYRIPYGNSWATLVTLRRSQLLNSEGENKPDASLHARQDLATFTDIIQAMTVHPDSEETMTAILQGLGRIFPFDTSIIALWDENLGAIQPYLWSMQGRESHLEKYPPLFSTDVDAEKSILFQQKSMLLNVKPGEKKPFIHPSFDVDAFQSFLGVPLFSGNVKLGFICFASLLAHSYTEDDLELLKVIARLAANSLQLSLDYEAQQKRLLELNGLVQLSEAINSLQDTQDLFERLVESFTPLLNVEVLGFLLYDENRHILEAQQPFMGIPPKVLEWARFHIQPGSQAEQIILDGERIYSTDAPNDPAIQSLGLHHIAQAAGIKYLCLQPLSTTGKTNGFILAANKKDGSNFLEDDFRILTLIATQTASLVENVRLIQQSRRRALMAETLRRITNLAGSSATLDEILEYAVLDLARLFACDVGAVFLLDETKGELRLHKPSLYGIDPQTATLMSRLSTDDVQFQQTVTGSQKMIHSGNSLEDTSVLPIYHVWVGPLQLDSILAVPLIVREQSIGEIMFGSQKADYFTPLDVQTALTAAGQLAGAIERAILYSQTDESLRRRVDQLVALTQLSRELNSTKDLDYLIERVYEEALKTTGADCGTILLFAYRESMGFPSADPQIIFYLGEAPAGELRPEERWVVNTGETLVVEDYLSAKADTLPLAGISQAEVSPIQTVHDGIRSALIVPIAHQEQIVGLIHLHSQEPHLFDRTAREIAESLAIQAAIAIGNAQRYQEEVRRNEMLVQRVDTLAKLFEISQLLQLELPMDKALENIAYAIQGATPFNSVRISINDLDGVSLTPIVGVGVSGEWAKEERTELLSWDFVQQWMQERYRLGRAFFIPAEERFRTLSAESDHEGLEESEYELHPSRFSWHPQDIFILPLFTSTGNPLGLIQLDKPRDNLRPEKATVMSLEIFASQAALVIESHTRVQQLKNQIEELESALDNARQVGLALREQLMSQVENDLDQDTQAQRFRLLGKRITSTLQISAELTDYSDRISILKAIGVALIEKLEYQSVILAEPSAGGLRIVEALGEANSMSGLEPLLGQRNPLLTCLRNRESEFVASLDTDTRWKDSPLLHALNAKGFICLPILPQEGVEAVILAVRHEPMLPFLPEDEQIFELLRRQTAAAIQRTDLMEEINHRLQEVNFLLDFSRQLSSLEPTHILDTLLQSILHMIPMAEAGMIALLDTQQNVLIPQAVSGYTDNDAIRQIQYAPGKSLIGKVFSNGNPIIIKDLDFAEHYQLSAADLTAYRRGTNGRLPISCLVYPLKSSAHVPAIGVLVLDNFNFPAAFHDKDQALVGSLAQQAALQLENSRLFNASRQRASQLQALTDVSTVITTKLQPEELTESLLDELDTIIAFDTATLWLRQGNQLVVSAVRGFADQEQRLGLTVAIEDSQLLADMIHGGQPIHVKNTDLDPRFPKLLEAVPKSWLGLPLNAGGEVIGVIAIEKNEPYAYSDEVLQIAKTFAAQAAIAMENAALYQDSVKRAAELTERSQRLAMLNRLSLEFSKTLEADRILELTVEELLQITGGDGAVTIVFDENNRPELVHEIPPVQSPFRWIPDAPGFDRLRETLGVFHSENIQQEEEFAPLKEFFEMHQARSALALSMATADKLHGVIMIYAKENQRFSIEAIELARTVVNQAAVALQNARLYAETRSLTEDLEKRVQERTTQLAMEHRRTEILLRITTELTASLDLEHVLNRTIRILNEMVDAEQIAVMIVRPGEDRLYHLASYGYAPPPPVRGRTSPFRIDEGLAGWVIKFRQAVLIGDVHNDPRWVQLPEQPSEHRSAIGVPMMIGEESIGALLFFHRNPDYFSTEQLDLIQAAANQVAIAVNNAELYRLIRDQAEDLGTMFRNQQIETSRSQAILEAVADGVLVTDAGGKVTLFNASAERILSLPRSQVMGKSLDQFSGLFGRAAQQWTKTIQTWSREGSAYSSEDIYSEQIELDTGRVVSVNLAPVRLRDDFLGTVSVFRDITHQVELDRLKSEFVATVSHELRTPMTSIKGYVEVLLMGAAGALSEQQAHFLEIIRNNTERLAALVNDLLDISRIEAGKSSLSIQPLNLIDLSKQSLEAIEQRATRENKPMKFSLDAPQKMPLVRGDAERVGQILDNLLENAYQYSEPEKQIKVRILPGQKEVQIDVVDEGIGIPPSLQERVFERFYRGENPYVLATYGTGLGLSIVRNLVEMHRGRIWVTSSGVPGEGSTFSFTLPIFLLEESLQPDLAGEVTWQKS